MYALVLFDLDGCTAIIDVKKIKVPDVQALLKGQQVDVLYMRKILKVEILELSDSRAFLNDFEDEWSTSHRSLALDKEKKKRQNKPHGYLSVWPVDEDSEDESNQEPVVQEQTSSRTIEGLKGRKITVLYEGSAATRASPIATPLREPCYLRELSTDESEVVELQMRYFTDNKICSSSQTEKVVVIQDETEITDLLAKQNGGKKRKTVSTQTDSLLPCETGVQTDSFGGDLSSVNGKLDEILCLLRATTADHSLKTSNIANVSDIVRWVTENTSTPKPGLPSITILPVEDPVLEIPARYPSIATPVIEVIQQEERKSSPVKAHHLSPLQSSPLQACRSSPLRSSPRLACRSSPLKCPSSPPVNSSSPPGPFLSSACHSSSPRSSTQPARRCSPLPAKKTLFTEETGDQERAENGVTRTPFQEVTHRVNNRKQAKDNQVLTVSCSATATMLEIKDVVPGDFEFRIRRDILADVKSTACSDGNFMWILTRKIFREDELVERNFFGRKGRKPISPRRKRCLTHAYISSCGTSYKEFTKAVNSINNGIRSLGR